MDPYVYTSLGKAYQSNPKGLTNISFSCYINSVMQCLMSLESFKARLCQGFFDRSSHLQPMTCALENLFIDVGMCADKEFSCVEFLCVLKSQWARYAPWVQEDAADFLQFLLQKIHEETVMPLGKPPKSATALSAKNIAEDKWSRQIKSPITYQFGLQTTSRVECKNVHCDYLSIISDEATTIFTLPLLPGKKTTLQECLASYFEEKPLSDAKCPYCTSEGSLSSTLKLTRLPPHLIVHLSRFNHPGLNLLGFKNDVDVDYPHILPMGEYVIDGLQSNTQYELVAVVVHGGGLENGHYTAVCSRDNRWFNFDDGKVTKTTSRRAISDGAYLLWYSLKLDKKNGDLPFDSETEWHSRLEDLHPHFDTNNSEPNIQNSIHEHEGGALLDPKNGDWLKDLHPCVDKNNNSSPHSAHDFQQRMTPESGGGSTPRHVPSAELSPGLTGLQCASKLPSTPSPRPLYANLEEFLMSPLLYEEPPVINQTKTTAVIPVPSCHHQRIPLDVRDPILRPEDVPGAQIDPKNAKKPELERLLHIFGIPLQKDNKPQLLKKVQDHIAMGKGNKVDPSFDRGKLRNKKKNKLMGECATDYLPMVPPPGKTWKPFPSVHIPERFSQEKILDYFNDIPSIKFNYKEGVISATPQPIFEKYHDDTSDDDIDDDCPPSQNFTDLCKRAIRKSIDKGRQFLSSGRMLTVLDTCKENHYFMKAQVQASMDAVLYGVIITISTTDGSICAADCSCKAQELHRCGHIAAVCLMLVEHILANGCEAVTTTGRQCYWLSSAPPKDPGFIIDKKYPTRRDKTHKIEFDPRPTQFKTQGLIAHEDLKQFKENLNQGNPTCLFNYHLEVCVGPRVTGPNVTTSVHHEEHEADDPASNEGMNLLLECGVLLNNLTISCFGKTSPFEVPNTRGQYLNANWHTERQHLVSASSCKTFLGLTSDIAKIRYLRKKVWRLDRFESPAMKEGLENEAVARLEYEKELQELYHDISIIETGLWRNPLYPTLGCSPDGLILINDVNMKLLLEVKVLTVKIHTEEGVITDVSVNPNNFEQEMSSSQKKNFYLRRNAAGEVILKPNHQYHYQIQMSLDILQLETCHLLVWSKTGHMVIEIDYDPAFWQEKRMRLIKRHAELLLPEIILGRTKRWLPPVEIRCTRGNDDEPDAIYLDFA